MGQQHTPLGVHVRHPLEWYMRYAMGARVFSAAVAGQLSYCELYNNASDGSNLWVWGVVGGTPTVNELVLESYVGRKGTTPAGTPLGPLWVGNPMRFGLVGTHSQTACIGTEIGVLESSGPQAFNPWNFPVAVVPPGYSFSIHASNTNVGVSGGFWWVPLLDTQH